MSTIETLTLIKYEREDKEPLYFNHKKGIFENQDEIDIYPESYNVEYESINIFMNAIYYCNLNDINVENVIVVNEEYFTN